MDALTRNILNYISLNPRDIGAYRDLVSMQRQRRHDGTDEHDALKASLDAVIAAMRGGWADVEGISALMEAHRDLLTLDGKWDFDSFAQAMEIDRTPDSRLWLPRRKQLWRLYQELQWFETDPNAEFLSVSMPPRVGKSSNCSMAMVWHIGRDPLHSNLMTAHSDKLTKHFYQQCLQFVIDPEYRFSEIFPNSPLVWQSSEDEAFSLRKHGAYPTCTCRSIEGTLTGAVEVGEGGWLYADDLVKDLEEAMSPRRLDGKWRDYVNQCYDRRKTGARQLMVGTRWDVNDPIGRMTRLHEGESNFHILTIPALDPISGESNFDYLYGVGFDRKYYLDMQRTTDSATYAAKYDGAPFVREGQLYSPDSLERYLELPEGEPDRVMAVVDTKGAGEDYCAMPIAAQWRGSDKWFIVDFLCDHSAPKTVNQRLVNFIDKYGVQQARFESNAAGGKVAEDVADMLKEKGTLCAVSKKYTGSNKETRILASSTWVIDNCVFRDTTLYEPGSDYSIAMGQITSYVLDGKNQHDDAPDALSMLADFLSKSRRARARVTKRPF